jgi:hypothetical protein
MTSKLKPTRIYRPGHLRPVSREGREENDGRFRKKLAELVADEHGDDQPRPDAKARIQEPEQAAKEAWNDDEADPSVGRNIDVRT